MPTIPRPSCSHETTNIVVFGNVGCGKSTLLNNLLGQQKFNVRCHSDITPEPPELSAESKSTTSKTELYQEDGLTFIDTPALVYGSQVVLTAADEILEALKQPGQYKICFVINTDSFRLSTVDVLAIKTILEAIDVHHQRPFYIISNRVAPRHGKIEIQTERVRSLLSHHHLFPKDVLLIPEDAAGMLLSISSVDKIKAYFKSMLTSSLTLESVPALDTENLQRHINTHRLRERSIIVDHHTGLAVTRTILTLSEWQSVKDIKALLEVELSLPTNQQHLFLAGHELADSRRLADDIDDGSCLVLRSDETERQGAADLVHDRKNLLESPKPSPRQVLYGDAACPPELAEIITQARAGTLHTR
jgi:hypothetical protein